ncbi:MAG: phosphoribosylformylglycinamidine synthase subunit PurQ [Pseudomonadota bacterium]
MHATIIQYPGTNRENDIRDALHLVGIKTQIISCGQQHPEPCDLFILPGGFSYGDYLRAGAIAATTPVMKAVCQHANRGGYVLGICNGFQILCELGLLPGALIRNQSLKFICQWVLLRAHQTSSIFTDQFDPNDVLHIPIAHMDGNYQCDTQMLKQLKNENRIAFSYVDNINGSCDNIAGILSKNKRILGMMPHFENAVFEHQKKQDALPFFQSLKCYFDEK